MENFNDVQSVQVNSTANSVLRYPQKNKFAVTSLVLSIISILLFPLMIFQILGLTFGILGIKSERRGLAISGIVISSITIALGILSIISIIAFNAFSGVLSNAKAKADIAIASSLQKAIVEYISESGDVKLTFGKKEKPTVEYVINALQVTTVINGKEFGPYLIKNEESNSFLPNKAKGWEIVIDEKAKTVSVKPSEEGNTFKIN